MYDLCTMRTLGGSPGRDRVGLEQAYYEVGRVNALVCVVPAGWRDTVHFRSLRIRSPKAVYLRSPTYKETSMSMTTFLPIRITPTSLRIRSPKAAYQLAHLSQSVYKDECEAIFLPIRINRR